MLGCCGGKGNDPSETLDLAGNAVQKGTPSEEAKLVVPTQQEMDAKVEKIFGTLDGLLVKQTHTGCCTECLACEASSEFKISPMQRKYLKGYYVKEEGKTQDDIMYAREDSKFFMRCCWRDGRAWNMNLTEGPEVTGAPLLKYSSPCGCPLVCRCHAGDGDCSPACCCWLPKVTMNGPYGADYGIEARYRCTYCNIPKMEYAEAGQVVYVIKPETCCFDTCIACNPLTCKNCGFVPFYFHEPGTMKVVGGEYSGRETPHIRKVWGGFKPACCTTADTFAIFFPTGVDAKRKAGILGVAFLLNFSVFERQQTRE